MPEQLIISIGREFGSAGHVIAEKLAEKFDLPIYDRKLLEEIANEKNLSVKEIEKYDERPKKPLVSRTVRGYSNSPEEIIANMQFDFLINKADKGESFVVVGRCSETVLKEFKGLISIFILGDMECKIKRIRNVRDVSKQEAVMIIRRHDKKRKAYHNYYCQRKWGDSRNYDISVNSSKLGIDETVDMLEVYINKRIL